jgi:endogenous inhibitor of DNA gyrase (YacG/DUF329 family)
MSNSTSSSATCEGDAVKTAPKVVVCPQCGRPVEWIAASRFRPFCSERCKTLDLGAWAAERYRIPAVEAPELDADAVRDGTPSP